MAGYHSDSDDYGTYYEDSVVDERYHHTGYDDEFDAEAAADYIEGIYNDRTLHHQFILAVLEEISLNEAIENQ
ncbi:hypothetical protein HDU76_013303, partial [Blyttiomyces sp. JEL0837]